MKKVVYIQPQLKTCIIESDTILAGGSVTGDNGLGYGGVDEEGTQTPNANNFDVWSDGDSGSDCPETHNNVFEE